MDDTTFRLLNLVISAAILIIVRYVVPYVKTLVSAEQLQSITEYATLAVYAAEQILDEAKGTEKKTYVINLIDEFCSAHHFRITSDQINTLIESAVKEMNDANI